MRGFASANFPGAKPPNFRNFICTRTSTISSPVRLLLDVGIQWKKQPRKPLIITAAAAGFRTSSEYGKSAASDIPQSDAGPEWSPDSQFWNAFEIRQQMLECTSAADLITLLQQNGPEIGPSDVAAAWHVAVQQRLLTLARSGDSNEAKLVGHLLFLAEKYAPGMDPAALSTTAWALAASNNGSSELMESILSHSEQRIVQFLPTQLCTLLWAAASHPHLTVASRNAPFVTLATLLEQGMQLDLFSSRDLSTLLWAMGKANYAHAAVLAAVEAECAAKMNEFNPADAARAMHGFAMLRHNPVTLRAPLEATFGSKEAIAQFGPQEITLLMVAHGKLGLEPDIGFMRPVIGRISALCPPLPKPELKNKRRAAVASENPDYNLFLHPKHMAHLMWTFGRLDYRPFETSFVFKALKHLQALPGLYALDDINAIFWACGQINVPVPEATITAAAQRAAFLAPKEPPGTLCATLQHISNVAVKSISSNNGEIPQPARKFALIAAAILAPIAGKLAPEELSAAVIALGTLEMHMLSKPIALNLQKALLTNAPKFTTEALPPLAWALVRLKWNTPQLLDAIATAATHRCALMNQEGVAQLAWAFAAMERTHPQLAAALVVQTGKRLDGFTARDKARMCWAYAHLAQRHPVISQRFLTKLVRSISKVELGKMADPIAVAAIIWACGRLEHSPGSVLNAAAQRVVRDKKYYSRDQLVQIKAALQKHGIREADLLI